jgi:hypothetical protein
VIRARLANAAPLLNKLLERLGRRQGDTIRSICRSYSEEFRLPTFTHKHFETAFRAEVQTFAEAHSLRERMAMGTDSRTSLRINELSASVQLPDDMPKRRREGRNRFKLLSPGRFYPRLSQVPDPGNW